MATVTPINRRIAFQLNVAMVFEALILNRLQRLPKNRHEDWLRGLLVQGFLSECRARRELQSDDQSPSDVRPGTTHPMPAKHRRPAPAQECNPPTDPVIVSEQPPDNAVSFAGLRKVIG